MRIGVYVCHCGINISHRVDVEAVAHFTKQLVGVVVARDYRFMCSDPGQAMIEADIADCNLDRVVVASCSPRLHGTTFMNVCRRAGLNPYYFQMASVREQVSWVTEDAITATAKAKTLVAAAVHRVRGHEALQSRWAEVRPDMLVVGAGIAGMQSALDMADAGHTVHLVEAGATIGGHMLQFDKTFPTLDCAACIGTPKMVDVGQHPNIRLHTLSEVTDVSGFVGNFSVTIHQHARYIKEGVCTGCGECAKVCPVSIPNAWDQGLGNRQAIGRSFPQAVPITFQIEKRSTAPCTQTCPAGVNVQGYIQLIAQGKYEEAVSLIMERLPLPGTLGRICPHPCEDQCRRAQVDQPVAIRALKRFASDQVSLVGRALPPIDEREEKIAVIGSGPAGLTAAYYMRLKGYKVTLFEALDQLGGMLHTGIPDYRLPPEVLGREIDHILRLGVEVHTRTRLGRDFTLSELKERGFAALFLAIGAHRAMRLNIDGEESEGVIDGVRFLRAVNMETPIVPKGPVAVIGGGNVAIDAARTARRLTESPLTVVYRRSEQEMPAYAEEIEQAKAEGIRFEFLATPLRIEHREGKVTGFHCLRNRLGSPDASGRRRPEPIEGSEFRIDCGTVIPAIGQLTNTEWAKAVPELQWDRRGILAVDPNTGQTALPYLFAAGDMVTGPATAIEAVGAAHRTVEAMDSYLRGELLPADSQVPSETDTPTEEWEPIPEQTPTATRVEPNLRLFQKESDPFAEVEFALSEEAARAEAERCLNCAVCCDCMQCVGACEANAIDHQMQPSDLSVQVGSIVLATGYDTLDPTPMHQYGYGRFSNVFTALEFERLSNATGPTGGQILMRNTDGDFDRPPQSVALLHCIGSRDVNFHEYCSRVCCMYALKYTHLIKEKIGPHTDVFDFYIDMRCFGEGYEEFYRRCQDEGTCFIRGKVAEISDEPHSEKEENKLIVLAEDTLLGENLRIPVDMVILCTAIEARKNTLQVGRTFGVNLGADGFFLEAHPKLGPLNTATDGLFLAGCCQKPMDIPDTVSHASGAAAKALALAARKRVEIAPTISYIDPDICAGCQTCIGLCPYSAIAFNERLQVAEINPLVCKGCGSCSGFCPSGAAGSRHFKSKQIFAEIDGIFDAVDMLKHQPEEKEKPQSTNTAA